MPLKAQTKTESCQNYLVLLLGLQWITSPAVVRGKSESGGMTMRPTINVRIYRPHQVTLAMGKPKKNTRHLVLLSVNQWKLLVLIVVSALVIGLGLTRFFHGRIVELRAKVTQLQTKNTAIVDEYNSAVAASAQAASKIQVATMAKRKLHLFEPDQGQVRRMWTSNDKIISGL